MSSVSLGYKMGALAKIGLNGTYIIPVTKILYKSFLKHILLLETNNNDRNFDLSVKFP